MFKHLIYSMLLSTLAYGQSPFCTTFISSYLETSTSEYLAGDLAAFKPCALEEDFPKNRAFGKLLLKQKRFRAAGRIFELMSQNSKIYNDVEISVGYYYEATLGMNKETETCYRDHIEAFTQYPFENFISDHNMTSLMHFVADNEKVFKKYLHQLSPNIDVEVSCLKHIPMLALEKRVERNSLHRGRKYWYKLEKRSHIHVRNLIVDFSKKELVYLLLYGKEMPSVVRPYSVKISKNYRKHKVKHLLPYYFHYKNGNQGCGFSNCYEIG